MPSPTFPSLGIPPDDVIEAVTAGRVRVTRRAEIYEADGTTPFDIVRWDARLTGGTITVDRDRDERRMFDFTFENQDGALDLNPLGGFYYDKVIKAFRGLYYFDAAGDEQHWETQVGEFMIDRIAEANFPYEVKVTGRDYTKKCLISKISQSVQFPLGTTIESILRALAANANVTKLALPFTGMVYSKDVVFARGTPRWKVMQEVADSVSCEIFFRRDGYLTFRPYPDPSNTPITWSFKSGQPAGSLAKYNRSANDSRIFNHIVVVGTSTDAGGVANTVFGEAINDDEGSPTSRPALLQDRVDFIESDLFMSDDAAKYFAEARLRIGALEEYEVSFEGSIIPWLDAGDIVDIFDGTENETTPRRFLLSNFSLPMKLGAMSGTGRRVTIVGSIEEQGFQ